MSGIGLSYNLPERNAAADMEASARAVTKPQGIGLTAPSVADAPAPAPPPPVAAPPVSDMPAPAPAPTPAPAPQAEEPLIDFHKDPLGAIGLVLSSIAAGANGDESPIAKLKAQKIQEQATHYKTASLALETVDKVAAYASKIPLAHRKAAVDDLAERFKPALGGFDIRGMVNPIVEGKIQNAGAKMGALKELGLPPAVLASMDAEDLDKFATTYLDAKARKAGDKKSPEDIFAEAKATAGGTNEANKTKPITPAEQAQLDISRGSLSVAQRNAGTSAASAEESARHNRVSEDQTQKPLTEAQANAALFADRAHQAEATLTDLGGKLGTSRIARAGDMLPNGYKPVSNDFKKLRQAEMNFLTAVLRKESGASIAPSEFATGKDIYFPQPGDSKELIEQKAETRRTAIEGLARGAGNNYSLPDPLGIRGKH